MLTQGRLQSSSMRPAPKGRRLARDALPASSAIQSAAAALSWPAVAALAAGAAGLAALSAAWADVRRKTALPEVTMAASDFNLAVLAGCPTLRTPYVPTIGLTNGHVETIFAAKLRTFPENIHYRRECLRMPDGGTVALDWEHTDDHEKVHHWWQEGLIISWTSRANEIL